MTTERFSAIEMPDEDVIPPHHLDRMRRLFDTWSSVAARNRVLTGYFEMKNRIKDLGVSIPQNFSNVNCVVGWCKKAVRARTARAMFDGFVFDGKNNPALDALVRANRLRSLYRQIVQCSLVHGLAAVTVMRGRAGQPDVKVRCYSANQFAALWDYGADRIGCGIVLSDVDADGRPRRYVAYFPDSVVTYDRVDEPFGSSWVSDAEDNPMGRPMMELFVNEQSSDYPLGRSLITPELMGIVDKAMRDVLRMDIGAEFFTFPQRYVLGAAEDLFAEPVDPNQPVDEDGDPIDENGNKIERASSDLEKFKSYIGSYLAITRDENGEVPSVGQFTPADASSFTAVFENDAQRFSGSSLVPLGQLGVLSNTYTSSDALGAANDPLILEVDLIREAFAEPMAEVGRMMLAVMKGCSVADLDETDASVQAYFPDPSMPTLAARADSWTKIGAMDKSIVGTRPYYEGLGLSQQTIDRLKNEQDAAATTRAMTAIAEALATGGGDGR